MAATETPYGLPERRAPAGQAAVFTLTAVDRTDHPGGASWGLPGAVPGTKMLGCADTGEDVEISVLFEPLSKFILYSIEDLSTPSPFLIFVELESPEAKERVITVEAFTDRGTRKLAVVGCRVLVITLEAADAYLTRAELDKPIKENRWKLSVIWNTGRCGSTLLHKALLALGVASYSSPQWSDQLGFAAGKAAPDVITQGFRVCMTFEMHVLTKIPPFTETTMFTLNPKGPMFSPAGKHFHSAFPSALPCFQYRALDKVAESFGSLQVMALPEPVLAGKEKMWKEKRPGMLVAQLADKFKAIAKELPIGSVDCFDVAIHIVRWLNNVDTWRAMQESNELCAKAPVVRFDEFVAKDMAKRKAVLADVLVGIGVLEKPDDELMAKAMTAFETDSQGNSAMSNAGGARKKLILDQEQRGFLMECAAKGCALISGVIVENGGANVVMPRSLGIPVVGSTKDGSDPSFWDWHGPSWWDWYGSDRKAFRCGYVN